ncbi:MAG TPA: hypothetical protein PLR50_01510 [Candidatus Rifleibacterium sp.]|nr:hypothetical protein [Candidatus Rifleibacterium sp.]
MYSINKKMPENIRKYYIYPATEGIFLAFLALLLTSVTSYFIYHHALFAIREEIRDGLLRTASGIAACLNGDQIAGFDSPEKKDLPEYQQTISMLQKARIATKHCTYLYINRLVNGSVVFVVDPTPIDEEGKPLFTDEKNLEPSVPMTVYENPSSELLVALASATPVVSSEPYSDKWGTFYSAYVPVFDSQKRFVGTLGADLRINDMLERCKPIEDATKRAFFVSCALSLLFGTLIWFTRRFSLQLNESRSVLLESFLLAREFADQSSIRIGKQLNKTSVLLKNIADRLEKLTGNDQSEIAGQLKHETSRLKSLADKIQVVSELKCGRGNLELGTFAISEVMMRLTGKMKQGSADGFRLKTSFSDQIPAELYGPVFTYEELLEQMGVFFLKMFSGEVKCSCEMVQEGTREAIIRQSMFSDISTADNSGMDLLKVLCDRGKRNDFFYEVELAEAVAVPIVRELIYLLNSDIDISLDKNHFSISFDTMFQKSPETETSEDAEEE